MLFLYKCIPYESFEPHKVISCTSLFTEATLHVGNQLIFLQVPDESAIDHAFDHVVVEAEQTEAVTNADQYALEATDRLKQAFQFVYEYSGHVADRIKSNYDAAIKPRHFEVGSFVLVYTPPKQQSHVYGKWKVAWQGPFRVMKRLNATNYIESVHRKPKTS